MQHFYLISFSLSEGKTKIRNAAWTDSLMKRIFTCVLSITGRGGHLILYVCSPLQSTHIVFFINNKGKCPGLDWVLNSYYPDCNQPQLLINISAYAAFLCSSLSKTLTHTHWSLSAYKPQMEPGKACNEWRFGDCSVPLTGKAGIQQMAILAVAAANPQLLKDHRRARGPSIE